MSHPKLEAARAALEDLIGDTSVSPQETLDALDELYSFIESNIESIEADLEENDE